MKNQTPTTPTPKSPRWVPIRNGRGEVKGWIEMYYSRSLGWVTIPGASGYRAA